MQICLSFENKIPIKNGNCIYAGMNYLLQLYAIADEISLFSRRSNIDIQSLKELVSNYQKLINIVQWTNKHISYSSVRHCDVIGYAHIILTAEARKKLILTRQFSGFSIPIITYFSLPQTKILYEKLNLIYYTYSYVP